jgi:MFS family permease
MSPLSWPQNEVVRQRERQLTEKLGPLAKAALLGAALHVCLGLYSIGIVLPQIARAFAGTPNAALLSQLIGGITGLSFAVASPLAGRLIDRMGSARIYFWSSVLFAVAGTSVILLNNLYLILITRVVLGTSVAGALVAAITGIGQLPAREQAKLLGVFTLVGGVLALIFYYVVARLSEFGWRAPFALHLLGIAVLPLILCLPRRHVGPQVEVKLGAPAKHRAIPPIPLMTISLFMGMAGVLPGLFAPFYLAGIGIHNPSQVMVPLMVTAVAVMPASGSYGWLQHRLGIDGLFAASLLFIAGGSALCAFSSTLLALSGSLAIMALGLGVSAANLNAAAVASEPASPGRMIGIVNGIYYGAQALLPFVALAIGKTFGASGVFKAFAIISLLWGVTYAATAFRERGSAIVEIP